MPGEQPAEEEMYNDDQGEEHGEGDGSEGEWPPPNPNDQWDGHQGAEWQWDGTEWHPNDQWEGSEWHQAAETTEATEAMEDQNAVDLSAMVLMVERLSENVRKATARVEEQEQRLMATGQVAEAQGQAIMAFMTEVTKEAKENERRLAAAQKMAEAQSQAITSFMGKMTEEFTKVNRPQPCKAHEKLVPRMETMEAKHNEMEAKAKEAMAVANTARARAEEAAAAMTAERATREAETGAVMEMMRATRERVEAVAMGAQGGLTSLLTRGMQAAGQGQPVVADQELHVEVARIKADLVIKTEMLKEVTTSQRRAEEKSQHAQMQMQQIQGYIDKMTERVSMDVEAKARRFLEAETARLRAETQRVVEEMGRRSSRPSATWHTV
jgi:hypothetical protein